MNKSSAINSNRKAFLDELCRNFLNYLKWTKKYSEHTLKSYSLDLSCFFDLKKDFIILEEKTECNSLDSKYLENHIKKSVEGFFQKNRKLSSASRARKLSSVRSFISWLFQNNYIDSDFRHFFKLPKLNSNLPNVLSVDEIFSILRSINRNGERGDRNCQRDLCLFFLLYGGGLRVSEACRLKTHSIHWSRNTIRIDGKGGKQRLIALPRKAMEALTPFKDNRPYLFGHQPLSERKAYDIIKFYGKKAGLLKPIHPHVLRHSFATHLLTGGSDLRVLQELLGHKTLSATQKYIHLDLAHLSRTLEKHHPLNRRSSRSC